LSVPIFKRVDFSGRVNAFEFFEKFDDQLVGKLRDREAVGIEKILFVVDKGHGLLDATPVAVIDHLNLTGDNPLFGPNDPIGPRFTVMNGVYINPGNDKLPRGVAAGIKQGTTPSAEEVKLIRSLGADFYCYNLVPAVLLAAHAGWKVAAVVVPDGEAMSADQVFGDMSKSLKVRSL
jgi:purine-nucleoside phosphorylase